MTGPEHYEAAEALIRKFREYRNEHREGQCGIYTVTPLELSEALVHAHLAVAAATALRLAYSPEAGNPDMREWVRVASVRGEQ